MVAAEPPLPANARMIRLRSFQRVSSTSVMCAVGPGDPCEPQRQLRELRAAAHSRERRILYIHRVANLTSLRGSPSSPATTHASVAGASAAPPEIARPGRRGVVHVRHAVLQRLVSSCLVSPVAMFVTETRCGKLSYGSKYVYGRCISVTSAYFPSGDGVASRHNARISGVRAHAIRGNDRHLRRRVIIKNRFIHRILQQVFERRARRHASQIFLHHWAIRHFACAPAPRRASRESSRTAGGRCRSSTRTAHCPAG